MRRQSELGNKGIRHSSTRKEDLESEMSLELNSCWKLTKEKSRRMNSFAGLSALFL